MTGGVNSDDSKRVQRSLRLQQFRESTSDISITNQGDPQEFILAADERG